MLLMMTKKTPKEIKHLGLRIPLELHDALVAMAKADERSLSGEIMFILKQATAKKK